MSRLREAVLRVKKACKNCLIINNVYDCARPFLVLMGLFGIGGSRISQSDGVYTVRSTGCSLLVFTVVSLFYTPWMLMEIIQRLFTVEDPPRTILFSVAWILYFLIESLTLSTVAIGCAMTHVYCERLDTMFKIIHNIDNQLKQANIRVKHWQITLKAMVLTLITVNYLEIVSNVEYFPASLITLMTFSFHLLYMWTILFLLIIHERFVCLNKLLQENATLTSIQVVGAARNPRDSHMLRRISLARHVHEQLTEVVRLFSDTCRYVIIGLATVPIVDSLGLLLIILIYPRHYMLIGPRLLTQIIRAVVLIGICQANKAERRVLNRRLRHLVAFETDREIIQQVQQYIMYNAYSAPGLIDFQFSDIDNVLLLTIIEVIVSNALVIYSYTRKWH